MIALAASAGCLAGGGVPIVAKHDIAADGTNRFPPVMLDT
jgi:hypothetical protein